MIKRTLALIALLALLPLMAFAGDMPSIKGVFSEVHGKEFKSDGKTVEIIEFLSFYCNHCYAFEKSIPVIKGNFPKKIKWSVAPVYWGEGSPKPGEAYFLAVEAGKGEDMKKALFHANFVEKKDIGKIEVLESIAAEVGLGFDFSRRLRTGEKAKEAQKALDMAREYRIEETPSLVIAGNIMTNPKGTGHDMDRFRQNTISILNSILGK